MHIPDGYLSPIFSIGTGVVTVPVWARATTKVRAVLNNRTIPLLALFAAICFTIMMFNVPVPGGTSAHAVGGTLIAIVLGPEAAVLALSTAVIIQALFFGDGGVLSIFTNCLNLAIILPFVGYFTYRLIAGRSPVLSIRRVWAAAIGSYAGLTAAALAIGIELGLQPLLFSQNGHALYSPYQLNVSIPAMLLSALFGASVVEALITALGFAYIQRNQPDYLTAPSLRRIVSGTDAVEGEIQKISLWRIFALAIPAGIIVLFLIGLMTGGWNIGNLFGTDWSQVSWADVGTMLAIVAGIAIVLIPLARWLLPRSIRTAGVTLVTIAIFAPLGLIAPGIAYGEGKPSDIQAAFGYIPKGLQQPTNQTHPTHDSYNVPLSFFSGDNAPLWHMALGYEISGIAGILLIGGVALGIAWLIGRFHSRLPVATPDEETA